MLLLSSIALAGPPSIDEPLRTGASAPTDAAVVIGLEDYAFLPDVPYAGRDARAVADFLISTRGLPVDRVRRLDAAGREQIVAALAEAGETVGTDGTVWVYFAGHGAASPSTGERLLLGDDTRRAPEGFEARGVAVDEVEALAGAGGGRVAILIDACFNGTGRSGEEVVAGTRFAVPDWAGTPGDGTLHWAASGPDQLARPLDAVEHGAFTYLALGALRGWADGEIDGHRDGQVTASEAQVFLSRALPKVGIADQEPALRAADGAAWVLSASASEERPDLAPDLFVVAPQPVAAAGPVTAIGWDPELYATAQRLDIELPLRKGMFGFKDAAGEKVRGDDYMRLVRATPKGRRAIANRTIGITATVVGWMAAFGLGTGTLAAGDDPALQRTLGVSALGGLGVAVTGVGFTVAGQQGIQGAVEPLPQP